MQNAPPEKLPPLPPIPADILRQRRPPRRAFGELNLHPGENVVYIAHAHWIVYVRGLEYVAFAGLFSIFMPLAIGRHFGGEVAGELARPIALAGAAFLFVGLMLMLGAYLRRHHTELILTDRRLITRRGHIARESYEVMLDRLAGVRFNQTTFGRLLDYGNIEIMAAGANTVQFSDMEYPHYFADLVETVIERKNEKKAEQDEDDYSGHKEAGNNAA